MFKNQNEDEAGFISFHLKIDDKYEMDVIFLVITIRRRGGPNYGLVNSGEAGGHRSKPEVVLA